MAENSAAFVAVSPGERWGGFLFMDDPSYRLPASAAIPAPRPLRHEEDELLIGDHPGYREFTDINNLQRMLSNRARVSVPATLPVGSEFIGGYAVVGDDDHVIMTGLGYRLGRSSAHLLDPDLWIDISFYFARPLVCLLNGTALQVLPPRALLIASKKAIYQEARNLPGVYTGTRSSLNWFEVDGSFWTVQARGTTFTTLAAVAESVVSSV